MQFEFSTLFFGGVAGLSLASAAAAAAQCFLLQKRIRILEAQGPSGDPEFAADQNALASRVSSMQSSIAVLQSGLAELGDNVVNLNARSENARSAAAAAASTDPIFADTPRSGDGDRRKTRFQTEIGSVAPINLNRRGQMMRMHRRGESIPAIASALGISQGEVKLTVRMQEFYSDSPDKENSHDRL